MPRWVVIWVFAVLVPVNIATLALIGQPDGTWIAALAIGGMLPNGPILLAQRGVSRLMSLPHLVAWPPAVVLLVLLVVRHDPPGWVVGLSVLVLVVDLVSLVFDALDFRRWLKGARSIA